MTPIIENGKYLLRFVLGIARPMLLTCVATLTFFAHNAHAAPAAKAAPVTKKAAPQNKVKAAQGKSTIKLSAPRAPEKTKLNATSLSPDLFASSKAAPPRPAATREEQLEVLGQVRNLNMTLVLKNRSESIAGFELRKNYKREIGNTDF